MKEWRPGRRAFIKALGLAPSALLAACARPQETPGGKPGPQATIDAAVEATVTARGKLPDSQLKEPTKNPEARPEGVKRFIFADPASGYEYDYPSGSWRENKFRTGIETIKIATAFRPEFEAPVATVTAHIEHPTSSGLPVDSTIDKLAKGDETAIVKIQGDEPIKKQKRIISGSVGYVYSVAQPKLHIYDHHALAVFRDEFGRYCVINLALNQAEGMDALPDFDQVILDSFTVKKPTAEYKPPPTPAVKPAAPAKTAEPAKERPKTIEYAAKTEALNAWLDLLNKTQKSWQQTLALTTPDHKKWKAITPFIIDGIPYPNEQPLTTQWIYTSGVESFGPKGPSYAAQFIGEMQHSKISIGQITPIGLSVAQKENEGSQWKGVVDINHIFRFRAYKIDKKGPSDKLRQWIATPDKRPFPDFSPWTDGKVEVIVTQLKNGQVKTDFGTWRQVGESMRILDAFTPPSPALKEATKECEYRTQSGPCRIFIEQG